MQVFLFPNVCTLFLAESGCDSQCPGANLGEGTDSFISATTPMVVGSLSALDEPRLQQSLKQFGLHRVVCVVLNGEAMVEPPEVGQPDGNVAPGVGREVKRTLFPSFFALLAVARRQRAGGQALLQLSLAAFLQLSPELLHLRFQLLDSLSQTLPWHLCRGKPNSRH